MYDYIKGKYKSSSGIECRKSIIDKFNYTNDEDKSGSDKEKTFEADNISWIELFFNSNIYIAGLTLDYSEIDIWWLLNKRARLLNEGIKIDNKIFFLYNEYDSGDSINNDKGIETRDSYTKIKKIIDQEIEKILLLDEEDKTNSIEIINSVKKEIVKSILYNEQNMRFEEKKKMFKLFNVEYKQIGINEQFLSSMMAAIE